MLASELSDLIPQDADIAVGADRLRTLVEQAQRPIERVDPGIVHLIQQITEQAAPRRLCRSRRRPPNGSSATPSTSSGTW